LLDVCGIWFHVDCACLDKDECKLLQSVAKKQKGEKSKEGCNVMTLDTMKALRDMQMRSDRLESELNGFKMEIGSRVMKLHKDLQDGIEGTKK